MFHLISLTPSILISLYFLHYPSTSSLFIHSTNTLSLKRDFGERQLSPCMGAIHTLPRFPLVRDNEVILSLSAPERASSESAKAFVSVTI